MNNPKISIIVAMSENHVIGINNGMPWHIPGELPRFKRITTGHPIIMGRKTYESIGKPLPNRLNIIITRDKDYHVEGTIICHSLHEAIEKAKKNVIASRFHSNEIAKQSSDEKIAAVAHRSFAMTDEENEVFIIGGGQIFTDAIEIADKLYVTVIHKKIEGDTYFPDYEKIFTKEVFREDHDDGEYNYSFLELEK